MLGTFGKFLRGLIKGGGKKTSRWARAPRPSTPVSAATKYGAAEGTAGGAYVNMADLMLKQPGPIQPFKNMAGSFLMGAAKPALKAGAAFGASTLLEEIADQSDSPFLSGMASIGSFWAGTLGFRQALRAPLRGARAKWGWRRDGVGKSVRSLSRVYDRYMYAPERMAFGLMGGMAKASGKSMLGMRTTGVDSRIPFLLRPVHGAMGIAGAVVRGSVDRGARLFTKRNLPGISGRLMRVRHPYLGAMGLGAAYGAAKTYTSYESGRVGDTYYHPTPKGGINPRNWGGGITMMNARGGVQYRMGSDRMAGRMARGRRP